MNVREARAYGKEQGRESFNISVKDDEAGMRRLFERDDIGTAVSQVLENWGQMADTIYYQGYRDEVLNAFEEEFSKAFHAEAEKYFGRSNPVRRSGLIISKAWQGSKADYVSKPGRYGAVPYSELAMSTRTAGKTVVQYALFKQRGRINWAQVRLEDGTLLDGLPGEVMPFEIRQHVNPYHAGPRRTTTIFQLIQLKSAMKLEMKGLKHSRGSAIAFTRQLFGVGRQVTPAELIEQAQALIDSAHAAGAALTTPFEINIEGFTYDNPLTEDEAIYYTKRAVGYAKEAFKAPGKKRSEFLYGKAMGLLSAPVSDLTGPRSLRKRIRSIKDRITQRYQAGTLPFENVYINGRRWFQKSYGNTYHSVNVIVDGKGYYSDKHYGYGDQYIQTAHALLVDNGVLPKGMTYSEFIQLTRDHRDVFHISVKDVSREKDL